MPLAARADSGIVDVRALPRLEGAVEDTSRTQSYSLSYGVRTVVAVTTAATRKLLAADGWVQFLRPLDEKSSIARLSRKPSKGSAYISPKASAGPTNR